MYDVHEGTFEPEQLASIRQNFDDVRSILRDLGQAVAPDQLASTMIRMAANGLRDRELTEAALRVFVRKSAMT
ncbi:MAG: hypothetical protein AB7L90_26565 [Hyphomicrobiaceae bacterium]